MSKSNVINIKTGKPAGDEDKLTKDDLIRILKGK
tara:strand:- start:858 stop:959 length:102 start_codon:yes stop_codon:yes gene_type:complete